MDSLHGTHFPYFDSTLNTDKSGNLRVHKNYGSIAKTMRRHTVPKTGKKSNKGQYHHYRKQRLVK